MVKNRARAKKRRQNLGSSSQDIAKFMVTQSLEDAKCVWNYFQNKYKGLVLFPCQPMLMVAITTTKNCFHVISYFTFFFFLPQIYYWILKMPKSSLYLHWVWVIIPRILTKPLKFNQGLFFIATDRQSVRISNPCVEKDTI